MDLLNEFYHKVKPIIEECVTNSNSMTRTEFYDMVDLIETKFPEYSFKASNGAAKGAIILSDSDYVLKFELDSNGKDINYLRSSFNKSFSEKVIQREKDISSCELEAILSEVFMEDGLERYIAVSRRYDTLPNGYKIYVQEKAVILEDAVNYDDFNDDYKSFCCILKDIQNTFCKEEEELDEVKNILYEKGNFRGDDLVPSTVYYFFSEYPKEQWAQVSEFLAILNSTTQCWDLHLGNVGFISDNLVVTDYSGD